MIQKISIRLKTTNFNINTLWESIPTLFDIDQFMERRDG